MSLISTLATQSPLSHAETLVYGYVCMFMGVILGYFVKGKIDKIKMKQRGIK